ncbi:MAG TPA: hypothetical protein VLQ89_00395, partial [Candidatus Binatia bacterium]|nr:hypothetical protein [Candidatus Binatia bacterium]
GKSVFLGGAASGILSIFPIVNLLNLFFMLWIVLGAALTIYLLSKENQQLGKGDAILAGALSGLVGSGLFAFVSIMTVLGITQERLEAVLEKAKAFAPLLDANMTQTLQSGQFRALMIFSISLFVFVAIAAGAIAGLVARKLFFRPRESLHG